MNPLLKERASATADGASASTPVTILRVEGMNCPSCARKVTEALQAVPGVREVAVDLETGQASVQWTAAGSVVSEQLIERLRQAGYRARLNEAGTGVSAGGRTNRWKWNLWLGAAATIPLALGEWVLGWSLERWFQWAAFGLASLVQGFGGWPFYRGAWQQLRAGQANMDTLVALGSTTAFAYSVWALLGERDTHVYFLESAAIITLISVGHWLEAHMGARASVALRALMELRAPEALRLRGASGTHAGGEPNETWCERVPVSALQIGDHVVLRPGDRVPVDGEVVDGESAVDESMLTGEANPVNKGRGSPLFAGTVILDGRLVFRVTAVGHTTVLAGIIRAVQRAQQSRAEIQRLGDRVSSVFVPVVLAVAVGAALWWGLWPESAREIHHYLARWLWDAHVPAGAAAPFIVAAAVLIVACPCAMGLATPVAIMAAANVAARRGILIRDGIALEKAGQITTVLFDKTGTLTEGRPRVVSVRLLAESPVNLWQCARALAEPSRHPLSQAVAAYCRQDIGQIVGLNASRDTAECRQTAIAFHAWREVRGAGIEAQGRLWTGSDIPEPVWLRLGSLRWLKALGVDFPNAASWIREWNQHGATLVGFAINQQCHLLFALRDAVKPEAPQVVQKLHRMGLRVGMITGDQSDTAAALARELGLDSGEVLAEVLPEAKAEQIRRLRAQGERVAFVGDGLNDAPALEQADLGIAVARASDIARESADLVLLRTDLTAVPEALALARASLRTIYQNLFWAFFYNAAAVPLAALGFLSPVVCALAMGLSDLMVIGNALRLHRLAANHDGPMREWLNPRREAGFAARIHPRKPQRLIRPAVPSKTPEACRVKG